jgi:hypothetical protein
VVYLCDVCVVSDVCWQSSIVAIGLSELTSQDPIHVVKAMTHAATGRRPRYAHPHILVNREGRERGGSIEMEGKMEAGASDNAL